MMEWMRQMDFPYLFHAGSRSLTYRTQLSFFSGTTMRYRKGVRLGRRLKRIWRRLFCLRRRRYRRLHPKPYRWPDFSLAARICGWGGRISRRPNDSQISEPAPLPGEQERWGPPPKGHLAVYVGGEGKDDAGEQWQSPPQRFVVPVVYFNHPLFAELLRVAEEEFGFHHSGGITIPCSPAKFEDVRAQIAAAGYNPHWKKSRNRSFVF